MSPATDESGIPDGLEGFELLSRVVDPGAAEPMDGQIDHSFLT